MPFVGFNGESIDKRILDAVDSPVKPANDKRVKRLSVIVVVPDFDPASSVALAG